MPNKLPPLEPQSRAFAELMQQSDAPTVDEQPLEKSRAGMAAMAVLLSGSRLGVHETLDRNIPGPGGELPVRIYWPGAVAGGEQFGAVLYLHGGGYFVGNLETHDVICRNLCSNSDVIVLSVDYRRAPEHKFPAAVDDCYAALCWMAENAGEIGIDADRIAVAGDSSGGALTITTCMLSRDKGGPRIRYQAVVYGLLTLESALHLPSRAEFGGGEYFGSIKELDFVNGLYLTNVEEEKKDPLASPLLASDFSGLPPALIITAGYDMVRDDNKVYAEKLLHEGISIEYRCYEETLHPFFLFAGLLDVGKQAQKLMVDRIKIALSR
ncbi:MAG: alpha/beta hydrolase [Acidiferrobacterales bacterium]